MAERRRWPPRGRSDVAAPRAAAAGQDFSGTNTQEVGVDEGDIVETDGDYVYVANTDGLRIVSVDDAEVVAEPELPQGSHQLLLDGDPPGGGHVELGRITRHDRVAVRRLPTRPTRHCCAARISKAASWRPARSTASPGS